MTLVDTVDSVVEWVDEHICQKVKFKLPDDAANDADYGVQYVKPAAFPLYVPGKDRLPPDVAAPVPSACVQILEGTDDLKGRMRKLKARICLSCWNPGEHGNGIFQPREVSRATGGYSYYLNSDTEQEYTRNMDGWRDSFNFLDLTLRELENAGYIEKRRISREDGITYGVFTEDGNIWDYYPYWHSYVAFTLEMGLTAEPEAYKKFL